MTRTSFVSTVAILAALVVGGIALRSWLEAHDDRLQMQATLDAQKQLIVAAEQREQQRATELKDTLAQIAELKRNVQTPQQIIRELPQYLQLPQPIQLTPAASAQAISAAGTPAQQGSGMGASTAPTGAAQARPADGTPVQQGTGAGATTPAPASLSDWLEPQLSLDAANGTTANAPSANAPSANAPSANASAANATTPRGASAASAVQFPVEDLKPLYDFVQDCRACKAQLDAARADLTDQRARSAAVAKERDAAIKAAKGGSFWSRLGRNVKWLAIGTGIGVVLAHTTH